jgi:hypothetical protein
MLAGITHPTTPPASSETLKNWIVVVLTLVFKIIVRGRRGNKMFLIPRLASVA